MTKLSQAAEAALCYLTIWLSRQANFKFLKNDEATTIMLKARCPARMLRELARWIMISRIRACYGTQPLRQLETVLAIIPAKQQWQAS